MKGRATHVQEVGYKLPRLAFLDQLADAVEGEGIGAELIRIIRQISMARARLAAIEQELAALRQSEIALLKKQAEESEQAGRDLLAELATAVREQVSRTKKEYETLAKQDKDKPT